MMRSSKSEPKQKPKQLLFEAIGTQWSVEYAGGTADDDQIRTAVLDRIERFDAVYSRFRADSVITRMARAAGTYQLPEDAADLFAVYERLYQITDGAVSPLVGQTLADAGYDASYSLEFKRKTVAPALTEVVQREGTIITVTQPALFDFGAAGKGYLVDLVCSVLVGCGTTSAVVNAGGDIRLFSSDDAEVEIALEHPDDKNLAIGIATISEGSICGSSTTLRRWGDHHHIINPRTGDSSQSVKAVWAYAPTALLADGLSTALFFTPAERLRAAFDFEYAIIKDDDSLLYSDKFPARFF